MDIPPKAASPLNPSEWARLGYVDSLNFRPNTLTREISPVFRFTDEQGMKKRWMQLSTEGYRVLEPVCRLASAMIESPASLAFLHDLLYSPRTEIASPSPRAGYPCYRFRHSESSLIPENEDPRRALERLAPNIEWSLEELPDADAKTKINWEACRIRIVDNGRMGFRSTIKVQKNLVGELDTLTSQGGNTCVILSQQFFLATTLCHEIAHALNNAVDPALLLAFQSQVVSNHSPPQRIKPCEPFFQDESQAELGHCWEKQVLGGIVIRGSAVNQPIWICKWPNPVLEGQFLTPHHRKDTVTLYIVPAHFIHGIQQQEFWDRLDAISLRVQKMTGVRALGYAKDEDGEKEEGEWPAEAASEGELPADEQPTWVYRYEEPDVVARMYSSANDAATTKWILELPRPVL